MKKLIKKFNALGYSETIFQAISKIVEIYRKNADWVMILIVPVYVQWLMADIRSNKKSLANIGPRAVEPLLHFFKIEDHVIREIIVEVLGDIGDSGAKKALLFDALRDTSENVRNKAAEMLVKTGIQKLEKPLADALKDKDEPDRWKAAEILGNLGIQEAAEALINSLKDNDEKVRSSAAEALGKIGSREAGQALVNILKDNNNHVRSKAAEALGKIGFSKAGQALVDALKDEDSYVRSMAAEALGNIGDFEAGLPLINALKDRENQVRSKAAEALGKIGFREAGTALINALQDENEYVRSSAAEALGNIGFQEAGQPLISIIRDDSENVRRNTVLALRKIGVREAVQPFITALNDKDYYVRNIAALALGDMGDPVAAMPLVTALKDINPYVRSGAALALGIIGDAVALQPLAFLKDRYKSNLIRTAETLDSTAGKLDNTSRKLKKTAETLKKKGGMKSMPLVQWLSFTSNLLKTICSPEVIQSVGKTVFPTLDDDKYVRQCAAKAFDKIIAANKPFLESYPDLLCRTCFLRAARTALDEYSFAACRHCGRSSFLMNNVRQTVGLIGGNIDEYQANEDKVYINLWSENRKTARNADIDVLEIRDFKDVSYDYAINAVLITLKNDASRPPEYVKKMPVVICGNPLIPKGVMLMLEHEFGEIKKRTHMEEKNEKAD